MVDIYIIMTIVLRWMGRARGCWFIVDKPSGSFVAGAGEMCSLYKREATWGPGQHREKKNRSAAAG